MHVTLAEQRTDFDRRTSVGLEWAGARPRPPCLLLLLRLRRRWRQHPALLWLRVPARENWWRRAIARLRMLHRKLLPLVVFRDNPRVLLGRHAPLLFCMICRHVLLLLLLLWWRQCLLVAPGSRHGGS